MVRQLKCSICRELKDEDSFSRCKTFTRGRGYICRECRSKYRYKHRWIRGVVPAKRNNNHEKAIGFFGNKCCLCEKEVFIIQSDFCIHHKDGSGSKQGRAISLEKEWHKCVLLCNNCHRVVHQLMKIKKLDLLFALQEQLIGGG